MLSNIVLAIVPALFSVAYGAPTAEQDALSTRSGDHYAVVYDAAGCSGDSLGTFAQFGCGGTCHQASNIFSVLLNQEGTGNPKPTADFFSDNNCGNKILHAGIFSGEHSGCSNMPSAAQSFYLYFNC